MLLLFVDISTPMISHTLMSYGMVVPFPFSIFSLLVDHFIHFSLSFQNLKLTDTMARVSGYDQTFFFSSGPKWQWPWMEF